jgi:outer membrane protein assembly factor BamE (lipoprotein component of BamABCDE complex)
MISAASWKMWPTLAVCVATIGCAQSRPSALTPGGAKMHLEPGVTGQIDVLEAFGTPNVVTHKDGRDVWVYDKISSNTANAFLGLGGIGGGAGGGGAGGGGLVGSMGSASRSETTVMLIIYFDANDVVTDYRLSQTKF